MTKRDLVIRIANQTNLNQQDVMDVVQRTFDTITNELAAGRNVEFRKFGVFQLVKRRPRIGRNPNRPEDTVQIPERVAIKFKPGHTMKQKISKLSPEDID